MLRLHAVGDPARTAPGRGGARRIVTIAAVAVLAGLALGRFTAGSTTSLGDAPEAPAPADVVAELEAAVATRPDDLEGWQRLGAAYVRRAAETGDPAFTDLAGRAFDRADEITPDAPGTLLARGTLALSLHDFGRALDLGREAVEANAFSDEALGVRVDAQVELGHYDDAAESLQQMLDVNPGLPALSRTSYLRELNGDLDGAVQAMQQAVIASSASSFDVATVQALLGKLHFTRGDLDAAETAYQRAEEALPGGVDAAMGRARLAVAEGDLDEAIDQLAPVVERVPRPDAAIMLADLYRLADREEDASDADALVRTLLTLQSSAGQVVDLELAVFEADRGERPREAVRLARLAHEARPDNVFAADALAWTLHASGDSESALPLVDDMLRLDTADPLLRFHAAAILAAAGEDERAGAELERVSGMTPWFSLAHLDEAGALAQGLGLDVPAAWSRS